VSDLDLAWAVCALCGQPFPLIGPRPIVDRYPDDLFCEPCAAWLTREPDDEEPWPE